jgi:hypothetical protein
VYVIRGMQLGLGLKLACKGISSVLYVDDGSGSQFRSVMGLDGWMLGCAAVVFILLSTLPSEDAPQREAGPALPFAPHLICGTPVFVVALTIKANK